MMLDQLREIEPKPDWSFQVVFTDGTKGVFDVENPYLNDEAFEGLKDINEFMKVHNGGYYIEWECGADLSSDTLRAKLKITHSVSLQETV
jgi:hypothetical protein